MLFAIARISNHDDQDFLDTLYKMNYLMLFKIANKIVGGEYASDIVTNAMLSMFSLIPKLRAMEERERIAYLRATVRNAAYKHYKAHKGKSVTELPLDDVLFSLSGQAQDPVEQLIQDEEFQMVREAIAVLPERDRRILHLKYAARLNAQEIAELTGAPSAAAVRERLSRARRRVLAQLTERGWSDAGDQADSRTVGTVGGPAFSADH